MQRFTFIHDGSEQGWQTTYLAFHVAAQLGAPLFGLIIDSGSNKTILAKRAAQVKVGAHAAGVVIETQIVPEFSIEEAIENSYNNNGLFVPRRLVSDEETARRFQKVCACPLWIVSKKTETKGWVVLVDLPGEQETLINYAAGLSHRLQQTLTGLVLKDQLMQMPQSDVDFPWLILSYFSLSTVSTALNQVNADLLILPITQFSLSNELPFNCVIYPLNIDA